MTQLLPPKKEVALALLERSNVDVYLDPRAKGVVVPPQFRKEPRLILKIGLNMPVPIPDLRLDDDSMSCTLSFNRARFYCVVPWSSVFAMVGDDGRGMVWPDDVPQELAVRVDDPRGPTGEGPIAAPQGPSLVPSPAPSPAAAWRSGEQRARGKSRIQPDAPEPSSRGKRPSKKKKEEATRPMLVAVPSAPASLPRLGADRTGEKSAASDKGERSEKSATSDKTAASSASERGLPADKGSARSPDAASKVPALGDVPSVRREPPRISGTEGRPPARPKRELPPYLRVVK